MNIHLSRLELSAAGHVSRLFRDVFAASEGQAEGDSIARLVDNLLASTSEQDLRVYTASGGKTLLGCILFSRVTFEAPVQAFILSPVAVDTLAQGQGVGQALIRFGLADLRRAGVQLAFTYGDPNYYAQVGFESISEDLIRAPVPLTQPEGWLCQSLDGQPLSNLQLPVDGDSANRPRCVDALMDPTYW